jgi:hypothetical protein
MAGSSITAEDRERFASAREIGQRQSHDPSAVTGARYVSRRDAIALEFSGGGTMTIPCELIPELEGLSPAVLASVSVSPAGDAVSWRAADIDLYIPGLVERAFGERIFAASSGRRGGRRKSEAKAAAARMNGARGGRPRKGLVA